METACSSPADLHAPAATITSLSFRTFYSCTLHLFHCLLPLLLSGLISPSLVFSGYLFWTSLCPYSLPACSLNPLAVILVCRTQSDLLSPPMKKSHFLRWTPVHPVNLQVQRNLLTQHRAHLRDKPLLHLLTKHTKIGLWTNKRNQWLSKVLARPAHVNQRPYSGRSNTVYIFKTLAFIIIMNTTFQQWWISESDKL